MECHMKKAICIRQVDEINEVIEFYVRMHLIFELELLDYKRGKRGLFALFNVVSTRFEQFSIFMCIVTFCPKKELL